MNRDIFVPSSNDESVGAALKTCERDAVVYVSPGHKISMDTSLKIVMASCGAPYFREKLPIPTHLADGISRQFMRKYERNNVPFFFRDKV